MSVVTVPCLRHGRHDLKPADAAKAIVVLAGVIALTEDEGVDAVPGNVRNLGCAAEAVDWATDSELYREHVDAMFEPTGYDPFEGA